jgi:glycosyltransferase 2 family protein
MRETAWAWARRLAAAGILVVVAWRVGTGPFRDGVGGLGVRELLAAPAITAVTTLCSAWRWRAVVQGLGGSLPLPTAIAAYYRSQFLNCALPGGVVGDVHRGVRHGRSAGDVGRGLRAVMWERVAGQVVLLALALPVLLVLDSPVHAAMGWVVAALAAALGGGLLLVRSLVRRGWSRGRPAGPSRGPSRWARAVHAAGADVREGLLARRVWPVVVPASVVVALGHAGVFLLAASASVSSGSPAQLLPLAVLVLLAMGLPLSLGGWGPREGVAAWAFGAAGLGAAQGVAAATAYGVLAFVATLPGALVLAGAWLRDRSAGFAVRRPVGPDAVEATT